MKSCTNLFKIVRELDVAHRRQYFLYFLETKQFLYLKIIFVWLKYFYTCEIIFMH